MRLVQKIFLLLFATLAAAAAARAADNGQTQLVPNGRGGEGVANERVSFEAILVIASDDGVTDASLAAHEATLKRVLRFKSYRRVGGSTTHPVAAKGETTMVIGAGYNLDVWVNWITDREIDFGVRAFKGRHDLVNTTMTRPRRSTAVVGGWATEDGKGKYVVIVVAK